MNRSTLLLAAFALTALALVFLRPFLGRPDASVARPVVAESSRSDDAVEKGRINPGEAAVVSSLYSEAKRSRVSPPPSNPMQRQILEAETPLIKEGALSVATTQTLLQSREFDRFLELLRGQSAHDRDAQDLTSAYRAAALRLVVQNGEPMKLRNFECGLSLCAGSLEATSNAYRTWGERLQSGREIRFYSMVDHSVPMGNGLQEHRFVVSVDPAVQGLLIPNVRQAHRSRPGTNAPSPASGSP